MSHQYLNEKIHNKKFSYSLYFLLIFPIIKHTYVEKNPKRKTTVLLKKYICRTFNELENLGGVMLAKYHYF